MSGGVNLLPFTALPGRTSLMFDGASVRRRDSCLPPLTSTSSRAVVLTVRLLMDGKTFFMLALKPPERRNGMSKTSRD